MSEEVIPKNKKTAKRRREVEEANLALDAAALLSNPEIITNSIEVPPPRPKKSRVIDREITSDPSWNKAATGNASFKEGPYSPEESKLVLEAMDKYILENNLGGGNVQEGRRILASQASHLESCRGAWLEIARVLPHRTVNSVYGHGIRKIHTGNNKGKWTDEDVESLRALVHEHGRKWKLIGERLGRFWLTCRDKWRTEEHRSDHVKGAWTKEDEDKLLKLVREHHSREHNKGPGEDLFPKREIYWETITKLFKTRSTYQLRSKWNSHLHKLASTNSHHSDSGNLNVAVPDEAQIAKAVYDSGAKQYDEIQWRTLVLPCTAYIAKRKWKQMTKKLANLSFDDQVEQVYREYVSGTVLAALASSSNHNTNHQRVEEHANSSDFTLI